MKKYYIQIIIRAYRKNFVTVLYQFLETGTSDRTNTGRDLLIKFLGFRLYPQAFYFNITVASNTPLKHFFRSNTSNNLFTSYINFFLWRAKMKDDKKLKQNALRNKTGFFICRDKINF